MKNSRISSVLKNNWGLLIILCVTLGLEILVAVQRSMWVDEFFSWAVVERPITDVLFLSKEFCRWYMNSFPPLYEIMVHLFLSIIHNDNVLALRFLSIVSFLATIILVYKLTYIISKNKTSSLLASFFIASNPAYFLYGGMLRGYAFLSLITVMSFLLIHSFFNRHRKIKFLIFISLSWVAMIYLSYFSVLIICIQAFFLRFYILRSGDKKIYYYFLFCFSIPFIIFIPWAHNLGTDIFIENIGRGGNVLSHINLTSVLYILSKGNWILLVHLVFMPFSLFYFYKYSKGIKSESKIFIVLIASCFLLYITAMAFLLLSRSFSKVDSPLYIRYVLPVFYIAFVLNSVFVVSKKRAVGIILSVLWVSLSMVSFYSSKCYTPKGAIFDIKSVAAYIKKCNFHNQKTVLFFEDAMVVPGFLYYYNPRYAYMATVPFYGNVSNINRILDNKNITIIRNIIGINYYPIRTTLENNYDVLVIIDTDYFENLGCNVCGASYSGKGNFIHDIGTFIKNMHLEYRLKEKRNFHGFTVVMYEKI